MTDGPAKDRLAYGDGVTNGGWTVLSLHLLLNFGHVELANISDPGGGANDLQCLEQPVSIAGMRFGLLASLDVVQEFIRQIRERS